MIEQGFHGPQTPARVEWRELIGDFREVSAQEIADTFDYRDLRELMDYQEQAAKDVVAQYPYSEGFYAKYGDKVLLLSENVSSYGLEIDDAFQQDVVIKSLQEMRKTQKNNPNLTHAMRVRISTLAGVMEAMTRPSCPVIPLAEEVEVIPVVDPEHLSEAS